MAEWEDGQIQTGIDKLMEYLQKEKEVNVEEAASSLDVEPETVLTWAKSLEESGLAEVTYTARRGRLIRSADGGNEDEAIEEAKDRISSQIEQISKLAEEKPRLERFEDVVKRMEKRLERDEKTADRIHEQYDDMGEELEELTDYLQDVRELETDIADLEDHIDQLKQDMTILSQIDRDRLESPGDGQIQEETRISRITTRIKRAITVLPGIGGSDTSGRETFKCKQCGKTFDNQRGLKTHRGMVHTEKEHDTDPDPGAGMDAGPDSEPGSDTDPGDDNT